MFEAKNLLHSLALFLCDLIAMVETTGPTGRKLKKGRLPPKRGSVKLKIISKFFEMVVGFVSKVGGRQNKKRMDQATTEEP